MAGLTKHDRFKTFIQDKVMWESIKTGQKILNKKYPGYKLKSVAGGFDVFDDEGQFALGIKSSALKQ